MSHHHQILCVSMWRYSFHCMWNCKIYSILCYSYVKSNKCLCMSTTMASMWHYTFFFIDFNFLFFHSPIYGHFAFSSKVSQLSNSCNNDIFPRKFISFFSYYFLLLLLFFKQTTTNNGKTFIVQLA